jgi:hypothetical protein
VRGQAASPRAAGHLQGGHEALRGHPRVEALVQGLREKRGSRRRVGAREAGRLPVDGRSRHLGQSREAPRNSHIEASPAMPANGRDRDPADRGRVGNAAADLRAERNAGKSLLSHRETVPQGVAV